MIIAVLSFVLLVVRVVIKLILRSLILMFNAANVALYGTQAAIKATERKGDSKGKKVATRGSRAVIYLLRSIILILKIAAVIIDFVIGLLLSSLVILLVVVIVLIVILAGGALVSLLIQGGGTASNTVQAPARVSQVQSQPAQGTGNNQVPPLEGGSFDYKKYKVQVFSGYEKSKDSAKRGMEVAAKNWGGKVTTISGWRSGSAVSTSLHPKGLAIDVMIPDYKSQTGIALGDEIAEFYKKNAKELKVTEVIWRKKIWTTERASEGWREMGDRGGDTANHLDHPHISFKE